MPRGHRLLVEFELALARKLLEPEVDQFGVQVLAAIRTGRLEVAKHGCFALDRAYDRLDWSGEPVDLDRQLGDFVSTDDQTIPGKDLIIRSHVSVFLNGFEVDLIDLGGFTSSGRANQTDFFGLGRRQEPTGEIQRQSSTVSVPVYGILPGTTTSPVT